MFAVPATPALRRKDVPVLSYILGGVSIASFGVFTGFGLKGMSAKGDLDKLACKPNCDPAKTTAIKRDFVVADVGLAIGVASLATAAVLLFTRGYETTPEASSSAKVRIDVAPTVGGGTATLSGSF